jgi:UDP-glucose 4-epimerase
VTSSRRAEQVLGWRAQRSDILAIVEDAWRWHRRLRAM